MNTFADGLGVGLSAGGIGGGLATGGSMPAGGGDEASLKNEKLDNFLRNKLASGTGSSTPMNVIVQTIDGLKPEDKRMVESLGGKVKDDLYIIRAFSAELTIKAIDMMILSPRVTRIFLDSEVHAVDER
ncbi:MAG: hypothetical protein Q4F00_06265 [bacterium]|nr:hypothetical protein [bacterium]